MQISPRHLIGEFVSVCCVYFPDVIKEMILNYQGDCINVLVPILTQAHLSCQDANMQCKFGFYRNQGLTAIWF